ncbi:MAG: ABC transporter permease [Flavobacteriales bacterium]|nr:ABC transporter permease [Bacteroidota bacterium]MCB9241838.1 ABC transporter permease [Flavobacteriales bacterium]
MDFSLFVGKKLARSEGRSFTKFIIRLAITGIGISLAVMLLAVGIVKGFQNEIRNKVIGFEGPVQIRNLDLNQSRELVLIDVNQPFDTQFAHQSGIRSVTPFCSKTGIINTSSEIEGMLFKGVPANYDWRFLQNSLVRGNLPNLTDSTDTYDLLLSTAVANRLSVDTGDRVEVFFIHDAKVRRRRFTVTGLFQTGLGEFDRTVCYTDIRVIQRIYTTDYSMVSGFEVGLDPGVDPTLMAENIDQRIGLSLRAFSVEELHPVIFQWLNIVDSNAVIIIVLMTIVAVVNLITAFLILILNRTRMIGILKSLGARNGQVERIFLVNGFMIVLPGLAIGNAIGLGLAWLQNTTGIVTLPEETYYMAVVPVQIALEHVVMLNVGTLIISMVMLLIPALLVRAISPVQAIRFN